ncbi:MAG: dUTP diphosphatase [Fusobacteriaceae bacterium]
MINFAGFLRKQAELDSKIKQKSERDGTKIKFSAIAEIIEFQETLDRPEDDMDKTHKTWKDSDFTRKDTLEEYVDIWFFISQMELRYRSIDKLDDNFFNKTMNKEFGSNRISNNCINDDIEDLMLRILKGDSWAIVESMGAIARWLGFTDEEIEKCHDMKFIKNLQRVGSEWL